MLSLLVTKVGHNVISASHVSLLTSFSLFASSNFVIFLLWSFEAYSASHHFFHQQCRLLVTKDGHTPIFASQVSLSTSFSLFASGNFIICFTNPWSIWCFLPLSSSTVLSVGHQRWSQSYFRIASFSLLTSLSQFALSNFVISLLRSFKAFMRLLTTLVINSCVRCSLKMVTMLSSRCKFFRWHLSQFASSKIVISFLRICGTCIDFSHFIRQQCCLCWLKKLVTLLYQRRMFLCWHLSHCLLLATLWLFFYGASRRIIFLTIFSTRRIVCWSPKMLTILYSHCKFFCSHLSQSVLFSIFVILFYKALRRIMLLISLFTNSVFCWSLKMVTLLYSHRKFLCRHLSHCLLLATS